MVIFHSYVSLPEGISYEGWSHTREALISRSPYRSIALTVWFPAGRFMSCRHLEADALTFQKLLKAMEEHLPGVSVRLFSIQLRRRVLGLLQSDWWAFLLWFSGTKDKGTPSRLQVMDFESVHSWFRGIPKVLADLKRTALLFHAQRSTASAVTHQMWWAVGSAGGDADSVGLWKLDIAFELFSLNPGCRCENYLKTSSRLRFWVLSGSHLTSISFLLASRLS